MLKKVFFSFCTLISISVLQSSLIEKPMVIVVPSYNNAEWYQRNLDSILHQNYSNYRIIYVNDSSPDGTGSLVEEKIKQSTNDYQVISFESSPDEDIQSATNLFVDLVNKKNQFFTLVNNKYRYGCPLANFYHAIYSCPDEAIIINLDGDDWFPHNDILKEVNVFYASGNVWLTHGRFIEYPGNGSSWSLKFSEDAIKQNAFRQNRLPSHLRTFYAWLFKKIKLEDLLYNGFFCPMTGDMAMMYPMIEMAGERHLFSEKINYVYNMANQMNENKINPQLQRDIDSHIRSLPPYKRLNRR